MSSHLWFIINTILFLVPEKTDRQYELKSSSLCIYIYSSSLSLALSLTHSLYIYIYIYIESDPCHKTRSSRGCTINVISEKETECDENRPRSLVGIQCTVQYGNESNHRTISCYRIRIIKFKNSEKINKNRK